jgi:hypothetical protein
MLSRAVFVLGAHISKRFHRPNNPLLPLGHVQSYLHSLDSIFALGLFTAAAAALISHKIMIIRLHGPLSTLGLIFCGPFLFVFDLITLILLHRAFASKKTAWQIFAGITAISIMSCSAAFASLYIEGNAEINWGRSVEVSFSPTN